MNESEARELQRKAQKAGLNEATLIRLLVLGYQPKAMPSDNFHEFMNRIAALADSMNQIARQANDLGLLDTAYYKQQAEQLQQFELNVYEHFMSPGKTVIMAGNEQNSLEKKFCLP